MDNLTLGVLAVLVVLVLVLILLQIARGRSGESAEVKSLLQEEFLAFQTHIHQELAATKGSVDSAKDIISDHAVKTISQMKEMGGTIQDLIRQQEDAKQLGQSLKDLLQAPKLRGNYGEAILEELLERVIPRGIWESQYPIDGRERVDCVVKLKNVVIPIDAKYPRDDYMRYLESDTPEEKASCWNKFETAIKIQINSIEAKYIHPDKGTSEFALMFIPSEAIYYETIADTNHAGHPSSILRHAQDHHVMPVSPNTLYAFLQMIVLGIRNAEVIQGAKKLQEGLAALERHFELYYKKHQEIGKAIERASAAYRVGDGHIDRYKRSLDDTLRLDGLDQESVVDFPDRQEIEGTPA